MGLKGYFGLLVSLCCGYSVWAQSGELSGSITFENQEPVIGVLVVLQKTTKWAVTDEQGNFVINNIPYGTYIVETNTIEAYKKTFEIIVNAPSSTTAITLTPIKGEELKEVVVTGKTVKTELETKGFAVNVVETQKAGIRNIQTNELLDRTVGIRIRQNGGLGSNVNYNINGMSGNSVRIFIDGIPMSSYGTSFNLNSIPPAMIERIEVYKGVVPGHLSDDALGGAINIVLVNGAINNINLSASHGSFNTSQFNFNGQYRLDESGFTLKASGFYSYSDNNYEVWGQNVFNILPNGRQEYIRAKRFNDAFKSIGGVIEAGFTNVKWADNFFIGVTASDTYKEDQHGVFMTIPYQGRFNTSDAQLVNLTYNKKDFLAKGLEFNLHGIYGQRNRIVNDTVKWRYNWSGERSVNLNGDPILTNNGAQQGAPTIANINRNTGSVRSGISYTINDNHKILLHHLFQLIDREDDDEIRTVLERNFLGTRDLQKNITSLTYEFIGFENRLNASVFGKRYQQNIERMNPVVETVEGNPVRVEDVLSSNKKVYGYGVALSYDIAPKFTVLTSAERAVRLPTENEVFGDAGDNISENTALRAETSKNLNLGFKLGTFELKKHKISFATNGFLRDIEGRIGRPVETQINSNVQVLPFVNQGNVKSKGMELEANYTFNNNLNVMFNTSKYNLTTKDIYTREISLPNEPFFTINTGVQYTIGNFWGKDAGVQLYYNYMFVDSFNYLTTLYSNNVGIEFFEVPKQNIHDLGLSYVFPNKKFILSVDVKNLFDAQAFDNLAVQKPGRGFYFKINYAINNF